MKIIASPANYNEALLLLKHNVDVLVLANNNYAVRNVYNCDLETIKKLCAQKQNSEIWVNVNAFFYEPQIKELENYLTELSQLPIDRVIFNDYAVAQINYEQNLNLKLHYDPNTLVTSYGQLDFYKENGFNSVSLSNELFLPEIKMILENKIPGLELCLQVHGFALIMHSRWNLVTNFKDYIEDKDDEYIRNKIYIIKEEKRKYSNLIFEDNHGTHMFSGYELCLIKYLKILNEYSLDYIRIDNILQSQDAQYSLEIVKIYQKALQYINENNQDLDSKLDTAYNECLQFAKDTNKVASGFVGGIKEIKHYENI